MLVLFTIEVPGSRFSTRSDEAREAESLLTFAVESLRDACLALKLFNEAQEEGQRRHGEEYRQETRALEQKQVELWIGGMPPGSDPDAIEMYNMQRRAREAVVYARAEQAQMWPDTWQHKSAFLHAKTFVSALDSIGKALQLLTKQVDAPPALAIRQPAGCPSSRIYKQSATQHTIRRTESASGRGISGSSRRR